jgi:cytochrome c oxidase subunit 2
MTKHFKYAIFFAAFFAIVLLPKLSFAGSAPQNWQFGFQEAATSIMKDITWLHNIILIVISIIVLIVVVLMGYICVKFNVKANPIPAKFSHNVKLEIFWTIVPSVILFAIAIPSFKILYKAEQTTKSELTIKVVGNQWYWHYQYPDYGGFEYDSYMLDEKDLQPGQKRLLDVDNPVVIPCDVPVKFLITSNDVIHSWAMPSAGVKMDAVPGRTNEVVLQIPKTGIYYGQCSELCGVNHGFMPIMLKVVTKEEFAYWITSAQKKYAYTRFKVYANAINLY